MVISSVSFVSAATIYGTVYDLSLRRVNNARVEVNTLPRQFFIAQNGSYSFRVPPGTYTVKTKLMQKNTAISSVEENITIKQDGDYVLDLILFPDVEEGVENVDVNINSKIADLKSSKSYIFIFGIILILAIILITIYFYFNIQKKDDKNLDEVNKLDNLIEIIKNEGGRTTQKEIRKQIPLSEAKISLMVAELEHKGIIEKIKKGRGNIIILRRK